MVEKVGFIGPGIMGQPMALNLIKAGYRLWVFSRTAERAAPLIEAGATVCQTPKAVAEHADVVISMVGNTADVEQVALGPDGIAAGASTGEVYIDMSTISASGARGIAKRLGELGIHMLDAPVSGGDIGAIQGTLSIMVGGKPQVFERVKPLFEALGTNIVLVGDHGAGQIAKTCNQIVAAAHIAVTAEALLLAKAAGVDPHNVRKALLGGFAASKVLDVHGQRMLDHNFQPGFKAVLHKKDMGIALDTIHDYSLKFPLAELVARSINDTVEAGFGDLDSSAMAQVFEERNGITLAP
ncbi:MAG: NAD(P)-dependent oxidoreductase [Gammaproteobacteria bacterium]|nr:NAD(P)-dependent oxidoreductase [Gammaproteobacteria bacterium]